LPYRLHERADIKIKGDYIIMGKLRDQMLCHKEEVLAENIYN